MSTQPVDRMTIIMNRLAEIEAKLAALKAEQSREFKELKMMVGNAKNDIAKMSAQ